MVYRDEIFNVHKTDIREILVEFVEEHPDAQLSGDTVSIYGDDEYTTITFGDELEFQFGDNGSVHGTVTIKNPNPRHLHVLDGPELVYNTDRMEVRA